MCNAWNHPPGCTCGWGGEGHLGGNYSGGSSSTVFFPVGDHYSWREPDFTHPTRCPECGADVFFIRHNGGSVWVDELGWPWPKHACFDEPHTATYAFHDWSKKIARNKNPNLGVVTCIRPSTSGKSHFIEVTSGTNRH